ncbi:hypothetical protein SASPL_112568 [Salvia splendens]|uniref:Disease resistance protein RPM1 n=1 Tax=Salvia splendens TaxID=180675 RepID=A0A4D9BHW9_SALSN|nr:hypothetical protein SASPL_112566 [Salvia splendens]KAG6428317.1 hypothetical protein SASPL_112568 [Salvia splendens]
MAYNLQPLITILQQILHPQQSLWIVDRNKPRLQSRLQKAESLLHILEKPSLTNILPSNLESRIRDVCYKAEDIIESHMVHQKLSNPGSLSLTFSTPDLQQVTQELDLAMELVVKLMEGRNTMLSGASFSHGEVQQASQQLESVNLVEVEEKKIPVGAPLSTSKNDLVGVDADLLQLKDLRVLDVMGMLLEEFPKEILQLVNLRYLAINCPLGLPYGISRLYNVQTLICAHFMRNVPYELWGMYELIHVKLTTVFKIRKMKFNLKKLQTLFTVWVTRNLISSGFFKAIRNIIKLGIHYEDSPNIQVDLSHLRKLEILHCQSELYKDDVYLKERKMQEEWEVIEGDEFRSLMFLQLESSNLVHWKADETNFPKLRMMYVSSCYKLEEIPSAIGDIPTLQEIYIDECGASIVASAQQVLKVQQEEYDNFDLKLYIR